MPEGGSDGGGYDPDEYLRFIYDNTLLDTGYEAVIGGAKGDAQACYGDSGSPVIRADSNGNLVAYGVISGGIGSSQLICDYGGVDAVFGPDVLTVLQRQRGCASAWAVRSPASPKAFRTRARRR